MSETGAVAQLHASAVAVEGRACLITGAAGSGKSTLAIEMMALGAELVADDRVDIRREGDELVVSAPRAISGMIEVRGAGLVCVEPRPAATLTLIVDLDRAESERLPESRRCELLGVSCHLLLGRARAGLASLLVVLLRTGSSFRPLDRLASGGV